MDFTKTIILLSLMASESIAHEAETHSPFGLEEYLLIIDPQRIGYVIVLKETTFVIVWLNKTDRVKFRFYYEIE